MIEIKNLVKKYGNHVAVDDISFVLEPGKIYGFLGPNGAGKSTTMNMITGYIGCTSGSIVVNGHDIFAEPEEAKQCIGYLPELPPLYQDMTVKEYLDFVAELKKIPKHIRPKQVTKAAEMTVLVDVMGRLIKNLSKGYKQRVGLAQAILGFPEIIILDEPTVGLDPVQIIEIRELIKKLGKEHTVILSSHILSEIQAVCDYVFIISKGKLVAADTTEKLVGMMSGNQEVRILVKGCKELIEDTLLQIPEVESVFFDDTKICTSEAVESVLYIPVDAASENTESQVAVSEKNQEIHELKEDTEKFVLESNVVVIAKKGCDIREKVFYQLAEAKLPILEMQTITKSLEEVFIELTQEGEN